ncbi:hypothetical protein VKT23_017349 [Stygiomarasmius scandens]|uniref:E3 ubiquitin-protein ligase listerin n=1 Tax=Marasmiellus scandens TaxID=2682957 RepID=A0ABR1IS13_9AGAR
MVKGNPKSSASSATRKKHARKAVAGVAEEPIPSKDQKPNKKEKGEKGGKKGSKKEPRQKVYIPPVKPTPVQPDPLETTGLAHRLPPELLVVLRSLAKKAAVTKTKALEDLQVGWVNKVDECEDVLLDMVPVWLHHIPALFIHPLRRIRHLAAELHRSLLQISSIRDQIVFSLTESLEEDQVSSIVGAWCITVFDIDRAVSSASSESWNRHLVSLLSEPHSGRALLTFLDSFIRRAVLDPVGIYAYLNPAPPSALLPPPGKKGPGGRPLPASRSGTETPDGGERSKADAVEESETDRKARIRVGALGSIKWILGVSRCISPVSAFFLINLTENHPESESENLSFFTNPALWSILHHASKPPFSFDIEGFGSGQPIVRRTGWSFVASVLKAFRGKRAFIHFYSTFSRLECTQAANTAYFNEILPIMSTAVLRSAFVEQDTAVQVAMWQPLLVFLKEVRDAWQLEMTFSAKQRQTEGREEEEEEENEDGEDGEDGEEETTNAKGEKDIRRQLVSLAYLDFLQFLQLGCSGSPIQGYPTVVIILSTIPSEVLASTARSLSASTSEANAYPSPLNDLFTSFWAAIDGRALSSLQRSTASDAFLSSLLECIVFLIRRIWRDLSATGGDHGTGKHASLLLSLPENPDQNKDGDALARLQRFIETQTKRVWTELSEKTLKVDEKVAAGYLERTLLDLAELDSGSDAGGALYRVAWGALASGIKDKAKTCEGLVSTVFSVFLRGDEKQRGNRDKAKQILETSAKELLREVLQKTLRECEVYLTTADDGEEKAEDKNEDAEKALLLLVALMQTFGSMLFVEDALAQRIDTLIISNAYTLLSKSTSTSSTLFTTYLIHRKDESKGLECWQSLLGDIAATQTPPIAVLSRAFTALASVEDSVSRILHPKNDELDGLVGRLLAESLNRVATGGPASLLKRILERPSPILSRPGYQHLVQSLTSAFSLQVDSALRSKEVAMDSFDVVLDLLSVGLATSKTKADDDESLMLSVLPDVFLLGYLFSKTTGSQESGVFAKAKKIWDDWPHDSLNVTEGVYVQLKERLKEILVDTQVRFSPGQIVQTLSDLSRNCPIDPIHDLLPPQTQFDKLLDLLPPDPIDPSLAVLDPLIPPSSCFSQASEDEDATTPPSYDTYGYSSYARLIIALVHIILDIDRQLSRKKENMWLLGHLLAAEMYAEDLINVPEGKSVVFSSAAIISSSTVNDESMSEAELDLAEVIVRIQQIVTYVLTSATMEGWRTRALGVLDGKGSVGELESHAKFLVDVVQRSLHKDTSRECRVLYSVLQHILDDVDKEEAEAWILFARKIEKSAPETCMTIVAAISRFCPSPPRLERYRNELAASLLGISSSKADTEGLLALRKLAAAAPDPDSDIAFLPPQRAVNVIKSCEQWISSDEDIGEEVECAMTLTFFHLAPILQSVPGGHWAFIFDVVENNLESCSLVDNDTLVTLARTLRLVILIRDLASTNKELRVDWVERETAVLTLVRNFATSQLESKQPSAPISACRELILSIVQDLPSGLIDHETLPKMCHLLLDPSADVQKMAYQLLQQAAKKWTEHLVVEAGVDTEETVKVELPDELMVILQQSLSFDFEENEQQDQNLFGHFLGWMLLFDLFADTSLKVRVGYIDQLRNSGVIGTHFIPGIFEFLGLNQGIVKAFKLDRWAVDEYFINFYEPGPSHFFSLKVLAAHLYYRALLTVPSLIHAWVLDCKDRQLSSAVATYTSTHFSPLIIKAELAHVKDPESTLELADENLSIKVASLTNEVAASYLVDEHQLEIRLKIPTDWPLHRVEIKDVKRVGVDENRWRAWILAVQQTIWAQNGRIVDGLALFKKNVTLHFEGQVECAICYSIISVMDGSLPKKPCKTCRNRFHAGCLYKWFNSSHSSSCPLCRSDILH